MKKAQQKIETILTDKDTSKTKPNINFTNISTSYKLSSKIIIFSYKDQETLFTSTLSLDSIIYSYINKNELYEKYTLFNLSPIEINEYFSLNEQKKIINLKAPKNHPSFNLYFILEFTIFLKNYILNNEHVSIILFCSSEDVQKALLLLSTSLSFISNNIQTSKNLSQNGSGAFEVYSHIELQNSVSDIYEYIKNNGCSNIKRYINYYDTIRNSPILEYKNIYLNCVIINGAPAIDNEKNEYNKNKYITVDNHSFYTPVLRIISNGKLIYTSYKLNDSNNSFERLKYSNDNSKIFHINNFLFGDVVFEVYHAYTISNNQQNTIMKFLFSIQINTLFLNFDMSSNIKLSKRDIDNIRKDIRYPNEFNIDIIFDSTKSEQRSVYDEDVSRIKNVISEFVIQSGIKKSFNGEECRKRVDQDKINENEDLLIKNNERDTKIHENRDNDNDDDLNDYLNELKSKAI